MFGKKKKKFKQETLLKIRGALEFIQLGNTTRAACRRMRLNRQSLYNWLNSDIKHSELYYTALKGRDADVVDALYVKACSGDVAAIKYWLNNQDSSKWSERVKQELMQEVNVTNRMFDSCTIEDEDGNLLEEIKVEEVKELTKEEQQFEDVFGDNSVINNEDLDDDYHPELEENDPGGSALESNKWASPRIADIEDEDEPRITNF